MGRRGPKATPAYLKLLAGNPGKRALPKGFVTASGQAVKPSYVRGHAATVWKQIMAAMPPGLYTDADVVILVAYCQAAAAQKAACKALAGGRHVVNGEINPWVRVARQAAQVIVSTGTRLGLSPTARENLQPPPPPPTVSKFAGLVGNFKSTLTDKETTNE